ncbi:hypothetical protein K3181_06795 [Qipengyuania sp. YG27]|uniref:J domain-containing protein n=1 Tax=Qipengyuania mesophila TaxID=2867246 RepID=A0ABS7JU07_9SPHN|nr:hypothetical protein [Qipengyuania mesophila]MBX7501145.1 hypothetical protein [Qipengyuania mesophila]
MASSAARRPGTRPLTGRAAGSWPWSELGIAETADKEAILEAYRTKIGRIDRSSPISAYTRLSEAREKALSLAAQSPTVVEGEGTPHALAAPLEPLDGQPTEQEADAAQQASEARSVYVDAGVADAARDTDSGGPWLDDSKDARREEYSQQWSAGFSQTVDRWRMVALGIFAILFLVVKLVALVRGDEPETAYPQSAEEVLADEEKVARAAPVVPELFGNGYSMATLRATNPDLAAVIVHAAHNQFATTDIESARGVLRTVIIYARPAMERDMLIEETAVYLMWLRSAEAAQDGSCRDVTGHSFFDGLPKLSPDDLEKEQAFARKFAQGGSYGNDDDIHNRALPPVPGWALVEAEKKTGLDRAVIGAALEDLAHPERCRVTIAVLEALLAQPDDVPERLLIGL